MTKFAKRLCKPVAWAVVLATAAQLGTMAASAQYGGHQVGSAAVTSTAVRDDYYEESVQGQNKVTKYRNQEDGKIKTILWISGINPPIMGGSNSQFKRIEMSQGQERYVDYISPYFPEHGWYDVNKTEDREDDQNLCFAAAASNSLHWWMEQNADYISRYAQTDISAGVKEKINKYNHSFISQSDSEIYRLFVGQFGKKKEGYWPDILQDQFINGYHPSPNGGTNDSDAARDKLLKGPHALGGVFFDIFKTNMLTQRCGYGNNYHDFSRDMRDFILDDKLVLLTYATGALSHVVTVWGAEFDANGEISGVYLTDSDDDPKDGMRRYNVVNSGGTPILTTRVGSSNGSKIVMLETLSLGKDLWGYGLKDDKRPLGVEWSDREFEYDGNVHVPKAKLSNVSYGDQVTVEVMGGQSDAGEHTATAVISGADAERYELSLNASTTFTIAKTAADVDIEVDRKTYENDGTVTLTAAVFGVSGNNAAMPDGAVRFVDCSNGAEHTLGTAQLKNGTAVYVWTGMSAGNYEVAAVFEGDSNYKQTHSHSVFVSLGERPQGELVMEPIGTKTYGDGPFALSTNYGSGSDVVEFQSSAPDVIEISGNMAAIKKAGTAVITAKRVGAADQDANKAAVTVQVGKKDLILSADSHSGIIQGAAMPAFTYTVQGLVNGDTVTGKPTITAQVSDTNTVGEFPLVISGGTVQNQDSYQISYVDGMLSIVKKPEEPAKPPVFNDVFRDDFYYEAVQWAAEKGITKGINEHEFAPDRTCTRAETVAMLWRAAGRPEVSYDHGFFDVSPDAYYATAVSWAKKMGITAGVEEHEFAPDQVCTRAEIVTLLWRYHGSPDVNPSTSFVDVETDSFYAKSVYWAEANRITVGTGDGEFSPNGPNSRAEMVTFLYRARDIS